MPDGFIKKLFGTKNTRDIKRMQRAVGRINALEASMQTLDDGALAA